MSNGAPNEPDRWYLLAAFALPGGGAVWGCGVHAVATTGNSISAWLAVAVGLAVVVASFYRLVRDR